MADFFWWGDVLRSHVQRSCCLPLTSDPGECPVLVGHSEPQVEGPEAVLILRCYKLEVKNIRLTTHPPTKIVLKRREKKSKMVFAPISAKMGIVFIHTLKILGNGDFYCQIQLFT